MLKNKQKPVTYHIRQAIGIDKDSRQRKKHILISSGVTLFFSLILAILYLTRYGDVGTAEEHREAIKEGYGFQTIPANETALVYD